MLAIFLIWKSHIQSALFVIALILAWRYAAAPEKLSAVILVGTKIADLIIRSLGSHQSSFGSILIEYLALDMATFVAFLIIAIKANRLYPLWLCSFQLFAVMGHFASGMKTAAPIAYAVMAILPSYALILVTLLGIWAHTRRTRRFGATRAWRSSPPVPPSQGKDRLHSP